MNDKSIVIKCKLESSIFITNLAYLWISVLGEYTPTTEIKPIKKSKQKIIKHNERIRQILGIFKITQNMKRID